MDPNDQRYIQIGLKIACYRKLNRLTQEQLAEKVGVSAGSLSQVETPSTAQPISLNLLFAFADLFHVQPKVFLEFDEISP